MFLVRMKNGDRVCKTVLEVKAIPENEVIGFYSLVPIAYIDLVTNADIRDCIYEYLKGDNFR